MGYRVRRSEVDDAVAEVFRIAFEKRRSFDPSASSAKPWLLGIAVNVTRQSHRSAERGRRAVRRSAAGSVGHIDPLLAVDDRVDATETVSQMGAMIDQLSAAEREVLLMTVWDELSPSEIAAALDVGAATVRTRLFRARNALRRALEDVDEDLCGDAVAEKEAT